MFVFVYIDSFNNVDLARLKEQLSIYESYGRVVVIDNSLQDSERQAFFELVNEGELTKVEYSINDEKLMPGNCLNQCLIQNRDTVLVVSARVSIEKAAIDEMLAVYDISRHHAFVIPRTDMGHVQSVPITRYLYGASSYDNERMRKIMESLPRYTVVPSTYDECVLLDGKRLLDICALNEEYYSLDMAIMDYSILMANYGYDTVEANKALAHGVKSDVRLLAKENDRGVFESRIKPHYDLLEKKFFEIHLSEKDYFAEYLMDAREDKTKSILYYASHISNIHNGSGVLGINLLKGLIEILPDGWRLTVFCSDECPVIKDICVSSNVSCITAMEDLQLYDIAFAPFHIYSPEQLNSIITHSYKMVMWPLDLIADRSNYLSESQHLLTHRLLAEVADGLLFLSNEARSDYEAFFADEDNVKNIDKQVVYIVPEELPLSDDVKLPFDDYFLIVGNGYMHKMIKHAISRAMDIDANFIVIGGDEEGYYSRNVYSYVSGSIDESTMGALFARSKVLVFPSIYEGFGIPVVQALRLGKKVFAMNQELNHELESLSPSFEGQIKYMDSLDELGNLVRSYVDDASTKISYDRTWKDVATECFDFIMKVYSNDMPESKLRRKWRARQL